MLQAAYIVQANDGCAKASRSQCPTQVTQVGDKSEEKARRGARVWRMRHLLEGCTSDVAVRRSGSEGDFDGQRNVVTKLRINNTTAETLRDSRDGGGVGSWLSQYGGWSW